MKRLIMALALAATCSVTMADVKYAVFKLTESEAFDFHAGPYKDGVWTDDTDKRQDGLLLIQYSTTTTDSSYETKGPESCMPSLQLMAACRFYLAKSHRERMAWAMVLDDSYQLTAISAQLVALTHIAGDTKSNLDESESMILLGKLDGSMIKALKGTQLTIDEGWEIEKEEFKLRRHQELSEDAQQAGDAAEGEGFEAAMDRVADYLRHKGYYFSK